MSVSYKNQPWLSTYPEWMPEKFARPSETVLDKFNRNVDNYPDQTCMYFFEKPFSFSEIAELAEAIAAGLADMGLGRGDRVLFVLQNVPQVIIASVAVWMRGGIVVPVNPMYTSRELDHLVSDSGAKIIICEDALYEKNVAPVAGDRRVVTTSAVDFLDDCQPCPDQLKDVKPKNFEKTDNFLKLIQDYKGIIVQKEIPLPEDLAYLVYTSGTTGPPKGAMISHSNIDHNCRVYEAVARLDRSDVIWGIAPLFHITGIVAYQAVAFHKGIPVVIHNRFDALHSLKLIEKHKVSFTVAPITVFIALLNYKDVKSFNVSSFTKAYSGGAPVSPAIVKKFKETIGLELFNVYGLTESTSPASMTPLGMQAPVDEVSGALSVGLIIPGTEAWIVDVEDPEKEMPLGEDGELVLRGPGMVSGYWEKPEETDAAIINGCFYTGDVAKIDEQGWCYIVDRKKDLINVSGFKVWPRDVEDILYLHPGVKEAAVVGVADSYRGETVKAFVSMVEEYKESVTPDELIEFCKERMAAYKYPRIIEILEDIPKTATGKILRRELKKN
jgi:long-chain acyl-CoA synthetase